MDSDTESDFYGDDDTLADLKARVKQFDVAAWSALNAKAKMPLQLQQQGLEAASSSSSPSAEASDSTGKTRTGTKFHNAYTGLPYAWQLTETVEAFLARLPPSSTPQTPQTPWICISNPYIATGATTSDGEPQPQHQVRGCEHEGPVARGADLATLCEGGMERLHLASAFIDECRASGAATGPAAAREFGKAGADAASEILALAHALGVRCGKWMIFSDAADVDETWAAVARATAKNELGVAAKVEPRPDPSTQYLPGGSEYQQQQRLICVYTVDFADVADVRRVARRLRELGLVPPRGKPLFYKPDAYTYLGIARGNKWGIRASIYDTKTLLAKN